MFAWLARFVTRHWLIVLLAWVAIIVGLKMVAPRWDDITRDGDFAFLPDRMTSCRGEKLTSAAFPESESKSQIVLVVARPKGHLADEDKEVAHRLAETFSPKEGVQSPVLAVWSHEEPVVGHKLISPRGPNGQAVLVILQLGTELMAIDNIPFIMQLYKSVGAMQHEPGFPAGLELGVTGSAPIGTDMLLSADESIRNTEMTTILLVVFILLLVYRAPGLVIVPLIAIAVSFVVSVDLIALVAQCSDRLGWFNFQIFKTTQIFIVVILFGAATDYCLFLISRYREELEQGLKPDEAIRMALTQTGHALTGSAMTTILGLGAMVFADFGKYKSGGPTIALSLVVALVACLTVGPALLTALGRHVFWPFGVGPARERPVRLFARRGRSIAEPARRLSLMNRFWEMIAGAIVAHPGLILVGSFLVMALPAYHGLSVPINFDLLSDLNPNRPSVQGMRLLERYFPIGETGPVTVLAYRSDANFDSKAERRNISILTKELFDFEYTDSLGVKSRPVLEVRSLTNPLGDPLGAFSPFTQAGRRKMAALNHPHTKAAYLSAMPGYVGQVTRFDLVTTLPPFSREAMRLLDHVERRFQQLSDDSQSPWHATSFDFTGTTAGIRDLKAVNESDTSRISLLVSICVLGVLVFLIRRPVISLYLIFTVLFGYCVSLGLTKLFFAWLFGDSFQGLDWKLPTFLFVILVAVGEDYNIYLVTRVFEEQRRRGALEGLRFAVARTGGIITSCGVIMAGTFGSMLSGTLRSMMELGFSLALGVLLDTFIIRTILVPAFLALWARWFGSADSQVGDGEGEIDLAAPHYDAAMNCLERALPEADRMVG